MQDATRPATTLLDLAQSLTVRGNVDQAIETYEQAIRSSPDDPQGYFELGRLLQQLNETEAALACYRDGLLADSSHVPLHQNLGFLLSHLGEPVAALEEYQRALALAPSPMTRVLAATVLPAIYENVPEVQSWRNRYIAQVSQLHQLQVRVPTTRSQVPTQFYLAYQGHNDRDLARMLGEIYEGPQLCEAACDRPLAVKGGRLRVGFLSSFFHDHTIGRLNLGLIQNLDRERFEVCVFSASLVGDDFSQAFCRAADRFVTLPREIEQARTIIASDQLDVLVFADVGMDSFTSTLAYSRMAPVQCATWGHPVTTGSRTVDYFVSSDLMEPEDGDDHYTERLVRLPGLGVYYHRPQMAAADSNHVTRLRLGLAADRHLYACPQTLFKFHPDFDALLAGILDRDPLAEIVLLEGRVTEWAEKLRRRFRHSIPDYQRIRFLPSLSYPDFLGLLACADVILDPLHFGGGNSSYEAFAVGTPVLTLPSPYLRGRITAALYKKMGIPDLIVADAHEYIRTAIRIACEPAVRDELCVRIRARNHLLFEDIEEVHGWEEFLWSLTESRRLFVTPPKP